jgi:RNA-directed DNA polymerase
MRPLGIPTVRDRLVQTATKIILEPIFEADFLDCSYGFRPKRSAQQALEEVRRNLQEGRQAVYDADLQAYFDTIPHDKLMITLQQRIADGSVLRLIRMWLNAVVVEEGRGPGDRPRISRMKQGTPQGGVISPLLSNLYLHPVDVAVAASGHEMVRYADDFVILCRTQEEAEHALALVRNLTEERGLTLHPVKTRIVDATKPGEGFDFLGYHFEAGHRWPRAKKLEEAEGNPAAADETGQREQHALHCDLGEPGPEGLV